MKVFAGIGIVVTALAVLGMFNIGHFRLYYGKPMVCTPVNKGASHE